MRTGESWQRPLEKFAYHDNHTRVSSLVSESRTDHVVRAITRDGAFRVITLIASETVRGAVYAQEASGLLAQKVGELVSGAILIREAMAPERRVQILIKDARGRSNLVADAHPEGWNRAIVGPGWAGDAAVPDMAANAVLEVIYTLPNGVMHEGVVQLPDSGDISTALMTYMQDSEQIVTMTAVRTVVDPSADGGIRAAGGYLIQLLPGAEREAVERMLERLEGFDGLLRELTATGASADTLREALLGDIAAERMSETLLSFGCYCNRERVLNTLLTLSDSDIDEILGSDTALDIQCDSCRTKYHVSVDQMRELFSAHGNLTEPSKPVN